MRACVSRARVCVCVCVCVCDCLATIINRYTKAYHRLAQAQVGQGRFADAALTYQKAIAIHPSGSLKKHLGRVLKLAEEDDARRVKDSAAADDAAAGSVGEDAFVVPMRPSPIRERVDVVVADAETSEQPQSGAVAAPATKRKSLFAMRMRGNRN